MHYFRFHYKRMIFWKLLEKNNNINEINSGASVVSFSNLLDFFIILKLFKVFKISRPIIRYYIASCFSSISHAQIHSLPPHTLLHCTLITYTLHRTDRHLPFFLEHSLHAVLKPSYTFITEPHPGSYIYKILEFIVEGLFSNYWFL